MSKDPDNRRTIGQYDDADIPEILVEWMEGRDEELGQHTRFLYRRMIVPQKVLAAGIDMEDRVGFKLIPFLENGGWRRTRPSDGAKIFVTRMFSLN